MTDVKFTLPVVAEELKKIIEEHPQNTGWNQESLGPPGCSYYNSKREPVCIVGHWVALHEDVFKQHGGIWMDIIQNDGADSIEWDQAGVEDKAVSLLIQVQFTQDETRQSWSVTLPSVIADAEYNYQHGEYEDPDD